jgi:hypothetical protein
LIKRSITRVRGVRPFDKLRTGDTDESEEQYLFLGFFGLLGGFLTIILLASI